jgi:hypothetical protein
VGLKGIAPTATETWRDYRFYLDRVAPTITVTNPILTGASSTVGRPYLQIQGFANEPVVKLSYDISNAAGTATNLDVSVTDQVLDTNLVNFTTNFFQAYDVPLTNGINYLTMRMTDRAGNTATTNFNVVLDYSTVTAASTVKLIWPQDGMAVSGTNTIIRGTMDDETGDIAAQVVNGDGTTNIVTGLVERNHMFWIENVPLNGTNQISIQATNAAGIGTNFTFTVIPSSISLTIDSTPTGDGLWQPFGSVSGKVSDASATVTINGVDATVDSEDYGTGAYNWHADNVPNYGMGTATFDAVAQVNAAVAHVTLDPEMDPYWLIVNHFCGKTSDINFLPNIPWYENEAFTKSYTAQANLGSDGQWQETFNGKEDWDSLNLYESIVTAHVNHYQWSDTDFGTEQDSMNGQVTYDGPMRERSR